MTARRRIECGNESIPTLTVEREDAPVGQPFFGFAQRAFENDSLTDLCAAVAAACRVCFADLVSRRSSFSVLFVRWLAMNKYINHSPDNVKTILIGLNTALPDVLISRVDIVAVAMPERRRRSTGAGRIQCRLRSNLFWRPEGLLAESIRIILRRRRSSTTGARIHGPD